MSSNLRAITGYLSFTLHAHLPFVVNHGTWPHGIEWLHEAAAETYLPLLRVLRRLERDGISLHCNLNLSPILLEQLAHPVFREEFPHYLERKIASAREDEAFFLSTGDQHFAATARFWQSFFSEALDDFRALNGNITSGFRAMLDGHAIDILTSGATHGYMPLLGTDESVRAQIGTAIATHQHYIGRKPQGMWVPECGYRPAGPWSDPTDATAAPFPRIGVEQALAEAGIRFFFTDTHMVEESAPVHSPYASIRRGASSGTAAPRSVYHPHLIDGPYVHGTGDRAAAVAVFPRDPRTGLQVWSGELGYPGDAAYLDFHKKRWPGGHRYWSVTGGDVDMADKAPYTPQDAADRVRVHAEHFVDLVWRALQPHRDAARPPILTAPFDAELFGHWWFEGPLWLEAVARILHEHDTGIALTTASDFLRAYPPSDFVKMQEGSWGAGGGDDVWLNLETSWTYTQLYAAELFLRDAASTTSWRDSSTATRVLKQLCRELLLLESSDWQFLITTGAARDYAEQRFHDHHAVFNDLRNLWNTLLSGADLDAAAYDFLATVEHRDSIFADIDPLLWRAPLHSLHRHHPEQSAAKPKDPSSSFRPPQ